MTDPTNASRTLLLDLHTLSFHAGLCKFFGVRPSALPKLASSSNPEDFGAISKGALRGITIGGVVGDQQGALVGNKCLSKGEAKCTYGTGAFLLFCTGEDVVRSRNGLVGTVRRFGIVHCPRLDQDRRLRISRARTRSPCMHWKAAVRQSV